MQAFSLLTVGAVGYGGIKIINKSLVEIITTAPLVDAAMEMKISVARDIVDVNQAAQEMATGSNQVNVSATELSQMAEQLKGMVTKFKI